MESASQVLLGSQSEEFGKFPCPSTSSTPIRVDTIEAGHIHVLLPTLEYSTPVSSPAAPGLASPRALRSRVLQALSASEDIRQVLRELLDFIAWATRALSASGAGCPFLESIECFE
jgi:hypothetical protein